MIEGFRAKEMFSLLDLAVGLDSAARMVAAGKGIKNWTQPSVGHL